MRRGMTAVAQRRVRHQRVRKRVVGSEARPRLCVFRSLHHIHAQVVDDSRGHTLLAASSLELPKNGPQKATKTQVARQVGLLVAQRARAQNIQLVVFDRGGYAYHGRVKALAEAAREGGLSF